TAPAPATCSGHVPGTFPGRRGFSAFPTWRAPLEATRSRPARRIPCGNERCRPTGRLLSLSYSVLHYHRNCAVKHKVIDHHTQMSPRPARKPLNTYHHGDLRDALVQTALDEVELGGPEAISISALAKRLGVSQPAPYKHFSDRESLLVAVTAAAFRQFSAMLREQIEKP